MATPQRLRGIVWALLALATSGFAASLWLVGSHGLELVEGYRSAWIALLDGAALVVAAGVGALLAIRRHENPVGWILLALSAGFALQSAADMYAHVAYADPTPASDLAMSADWLSSTLWTGTLIGLAYLLLLFPTGRPPTPRWRWLAWAIGLCGGTFVLLTASAMWLWRSPVTRLSEHPDEGLFLVAFGTLLFVMFGLGAAAGVSLIVRFRRAVGVERLQVRWIAAAGAVLALAFLLGGLGDLVGFVPLSLFGELSGVLAQLTLPVAVAVAVLRYRLYDIDRIVSRTVSYALLTGLLAGVYAGVVIIASWLIPLRESGVAVAAATLAAAAVFSPARRRIQTAVDRRFNRSRYDAQQVVASLRDRLRDDVDLADVLAATTAAVTQAIEPSAVGLWLPTGKESP